MILIAKSDLRLTNFFYLQQQYRRRIWRDEIFQIFFLRLPSQNNIELKFTQTIFSPTAPNFENISLFAKLQFITYRRESWGPDLDRLRSGGEPPLLAGWPWYQEAVGLSDEDRDTESVRERIKNELNSKSKRMHFNNVVWNLLVAGFTNGSLPKRLEGLALVSEKKLGF